jgi:hypothetical protein
MTKRKDGKRENDLMTKKKRDILGLVAPSFSFTTTAIELNL